MAQSNRVNIMHPETPTGRVVGGSLYEEQTTDAEGKQLVYKSGPKIGQARVNFFFAIAVEKKGTTHWAQTPWGAKVWAEGHRAFPQFAQTPGFSWKIEDGDDATPNPKRKGRRNCDSEGYKGCWIIKFSGGFMPKVYRQEGGGYVQVMEKDAVKPGYFVEVSFSVEGNGSATQPGVYLNHGMVCFRAYGPEIVFGPDAATAFGGGPVGALPAGASATPLAAAAPPPGGMPATPGAPPMPRGVPGAPPMPPGVPGMPPGVPGMPPAPPVAAAPAPMPPAPPAAPAGPQMTAAAQGIAYSAYIAQGWTDALLIERGMMLAPVAAVAQGLPQIPGAVPLPLPPGGFAPTPSAPVPGAPAPIPVVPNPQFAQLPPPAAAAPAPGRQMTAAAQGIPYASYIAQGWTDAQLVQNGMMLA